MTAAEYAQECLEAKGAILQCATCGEKYLSHDDEAIRLSRAEAEARRHVGEFGKMTADQVRQTIDHVMQSLPLGHICEG
jgi:hypothetical protein